MQIFDILDIPASVRLVLHIHASHNPMQETPNTVSPSRPVLSMTGGGFIKPQRL